MKLELFSTEFKVIYRKVIEINSLYDLGEVIELKIEYYKSDNGPMYYIISDFLVEYMDDEKTVLKSSKLTLFLIGDKSYYISDDSDRGTIKIS